MVTRCSNLFIFVNTLCFFIFYFSTFSCILVMFYPNSNEAHLKAEFLSHLSVNGRTRELGFAGAFIC
jgi:hypothetical protein